MNNKRFQARIELTLQKLSQEPGNDRCADCHAPNPNWASYNLGIFLCTRCASIHRKMGTHLSKVKSISLDTWTSSQVETVRSIGNTRSNIIYNPSNYKPAVKDLEDDDIALEKFIRRKYEQQTFKRALPPPIPSPPSKPASTTTNPFLQSPPPPSSSNPFFPSPRRQSTSSHRPYLDKASIMALYNSPPPPPPT